MPTTEIIRAYMLEKGDEFIMLGKRFIVSGVDDIGIDYYYYRHKGQRYRFGAYSRWKIELIIPEQHTIQREKTDYDNLPTYKYD